MTRRAMMARRIFIRAVDSEQWAVDSEQWTVDRGQGSQIRGQRLV